MVLHMVLRGIFQSFKVWLGGGQCAECTGTFEKLKGAPKALRISNAPQPQLSQNFLHHHYHHLCHPHQAPLPKYPFTLLDRKWSAFIIITRTNMKTGPFLNLPSHLFLGPVWIYFRISSIYLLDPGHHQQE